MKPTISSSKTNNSASPFRRRTNVLSVLILVMMAIIVARLFYMQIIRYDYYVSKADNEQVKSTILPATRGEIYALDGTAPIKMVLNETVYTVFADPKEISESDKVIRVMKRVAGGEVVKDFEELVIAKPSRYKIIARNVTLKQAQKIKDENLHGVGFQRTTRRVYPERQLASQVLGFVNGEGVGQYGIESALDDKLKGIDGRLQAVTDVSNIPLTIGNKNVKVPARNGENVVLTLDRNVQSYVERALTDGMARIGAKEGSVLVMDPQTGRILSMVSMPTYNPEEYTKVTDIAAFNNQTIMQPYEPGSVIKSFTVAMGIDKGKITASSTYQNTDSIRVDDRVITNATKGQTGTITMQRALDYSLNTGMVTIAQRLGDGKSINYDSRSIMYDYLYNRFGLGQTTGIELAGEAAGGIVSPDEIEGNAVRYSNMSFGQGMNLTMLQVAAGFSSIVNGGKYYKPTVIAGSISDDGDFTPTPKSSSVRTTLSAETADKTKQMLRDARQAFHGKYDRPGYEVGGKTGTSEKLVNGVYKKDETIASYLGYGGDTSAKYVIMVQVSAPGKYFGGSADAMPIFTDISNWMIDYMQLQPGNR